MSILDHPNRKILNSDWFPNSFTMIVRKEIFCHSLDTQTLTELKIFLKDNHYKTIYEQESPPA